MKDNYAYRVYKANIGKLIESFPLIFDKEVPKPLAIGILHQLSVLSHLHGLTKTQLRRCLQVWCNRYEYQRELRKGGVRYNVNLTESSVITEENKDRAARVHDGKSHKFKSK